MDWRKHRQSILHLMTMSTLNRFFAFCFIVMTLASCKSDEKDPSTEDNAKDRQEILIHWADNIIKPSYDKFKTKFDAMSAQAGAFAEAPDETTLANFRLAWEEAYIEWQKVELFEFGPADTYTLRSFFNIYPTNVTAINENLNNPSSNLDLPSAYAAQGFPAIDYLINGTGANDEEIVAAFTTDESAAKRLAYLERLIDRMNTLLTNVINQWNGSFRDTFISKTSLDIGSSMGTVVNAYVLQYERFVRTGKVGLPAGVFSSGTIQPDKVEAYYKKDLSKTLAQTAHQAAKDFFNGKNVNTGVNGSSLKSYLDALGAGVSAGTPLSNLINDQFDDAAAKLSALNDDFTQQIADDNNAMVETFQSMQNLVKLLKLDMTSEMSIAITYTDNDGD
jgi:predicted lipoprotein